MSEFKHCLINNQVSVLISGLGKHPSFKLWSYQTTLPVQCNPSKLHHRHLYHLVDWLLFLLLDSYKNIENYYFIHYLVNNVIFIQKWQIIFNNHERRKVCRKSNEIQLLLYKSGKWCASQLTYICIVCDTVFEIYLQWCQYLWLHRLDGKVSNKSIRICMEAGITLWRYYHSNFTEGWREYMKSQSVSIASILAEIWTKHLLYVSLKH